MATIALFVGAALLSWLVVAQLRRGLAQRYLLDVPNERSSHTQPTPRGGGVGIVLAVALGLPLLLAGAGSGAASWPILLGAALFIAAISALDDLGSVSTSARLATHGAGALFALVALGPFERFALPGVGEFSLGLLGWPLAFLWIVGLTNAYNFMDGIDGLAGMQALVAGLGWALLGALAGLPLIGGLGGLLAGGALGFLAHNWPPARIFMGDVGSAFVGYLLAVMMLAAAREAPLLLGAGVLLVWTFLFDAALIFLRRLRAGEDVFAAHRSHLYQRLVIHGRSHRAVTLLYGALALLGTVAAWLWLRAAAPVAWLAVAGVALSALALVIWVRVVER